MIFIVDRSEKRERDEGDDHSCHDQDGLTIVVVVNMIVVFDGSKEEERNVDDDR